MMAAKKKPAPGNKDKIGLPPIKLATRTKADKEERRREE